MDGRVILESGFVERKELNDNIENDAGEHVALVVEESIHRGIDMDYLCDQYHIEYVESHRFESDDAILWRQ